MSVVQTKRAVRLSTASRAAHVQRAQAEYAQPEGDIGGDTAAADGQVIDRERQRDAVELVRDQLVGELARKRHQVVGRDRSRDRDAHGGLAWRQWKESPQAQEPVAFGLSIVKPCFSIVSTKSMVAPIRYGALILSVTTCTPPKSVTRSPSMSRSSK